MIQKKIYDSKKFNDLQVSDVLNVISSESMNL